MALYYNGAVSRPLAVETTLQNKQLCFADTTWPLDACKIVSKWDGKRAILSCPASHAIARLHFTDQHEWNMIAPALGKQKSAYAVPWRGLALWMALGILILYLIYLAIPKFSYWLAPYIPESWLTSLGDNLVAGIVQNRKICNNYTSKELLDTIIVPLIKTAGLAPENTFTIVVKDKRVNAFTLPGNRFIIFSGLIEQADSPEELAGIMAHEIAHAKHKHSAQALARVGTYMVLGEIIFPGSSLVTAGIVLTELNYSRSHERQADQTAIQILRNNSISASGLERFFNRYAKLEAETKKFKITKHISTHPDSGQRAALFRSPLVQYDSQPLLDNQQWQRLKAICRYSDSKKNP